jgi:hypothetical protein
LKKTRSRRKSADPLALLIRTHERERLAWQAERRDLLKRLGLAPVKSDRAGSTGRSVETPPGVVPGSDFESVADLARDGLRISDEGEGVIQSENGQMWESAGDFRAHRDLCKQKGLPVTTLPESPLLD